jgi:hypothetical protein
MATLIEKAQNGKIVFSMGGWFVHNFQFSADFHKNTKEVLTKVSKKKFFFFFVPSKCQKKQRKSFLSPF